ncbi:L,D-transpeptidase family protein [Stappia sp.]|uniref:L,D-transpeptidase family protein n=1 Tax=Stappia sp. TaxID=1870903 RepID=UPI0025EABDE3|nr:L,D-transpeptidase family protein [Stappia sp.]
MSLAVIAAVLGASLGATPVLADTVLSRPAALSDGQAAATTGDTGSEAAVAEQDAPAASEAGTDASGEAKASEAAQAPDAGKATEEQAVTAEAAADAPAKTVETEAEKAPAADSSASVEAAETQAPEVSSDPAPAAGEEAAEQSVTSVPDEVLPAAPQVDPAYAAAIEALANEGLSEQDNALPFVTKARREAVVSLYSDREFNPLWSADGVVSDAARALLARLGDAAGDGLSPDDYALPPEVSEASGALSPVQAARFDLLLSLALVEYADHAQAGRVEPSSLSRNITAAPVHPDPAEALSAIVEAQDPVAALDAFNPPQPGFQALRRKLAELTSPDAAAKLPPMVPAGKTLKKGMRDPRVAVLRERLGMKVEAAEAPVGQPVTGEEAPEIAGAATDATVTSTDGDQTVEVAAQVDPELFDDSVKEAVSAFQAENGLHADGIVGPRTLLALNAVADDGMAISDVIANMERWRWLPRDLGQFHILVNIPEFKARLFRDGKQVYETRVVVGKPSNQTPVFSDEMDHLIVNPYWNVPYSIASQELLPAVRANSSYLSKRNYEVVSGGRVVDPSAVDWSGVNLRTVRIRQRPGRGNALGNIKFMFPNRHSVYLHDTPSKRLFGRSSRAFSHGCVRVQDPFDFADALLQLDPDWDARRLKAMVGGSEKRVNLSRHVPVHLAYFTAFVDENGALQRRPDIYGHNATLTKALEVDGWQDWQKFAVHVPRATRAPAPVAAQPKKQKREARSLREQRDLMMKRRMRAGSDLYR